MFSCFPNADARAQAQVGPGLATPLLKKLELLEEACKKKPYIFTKIMLALH